MAVAWAVWKKRCELLHKDNPQASLMKPLSHFAVEWALKMIDEYQQACVRESHKAFTSTNSGLVKVIREIGARLVVFSDASFNEENGSFSTGTVVTDDQGNLIVFKSGAIGRADSPLEAEVNALLEGIKMAREVGIEKALFLSDCFEAVKAINEKDMFWSRGGYTLELIREELRNFKVWKVLHLKREHNEAAHFLASVAFSPTGSPDWISNRVNSWIQELRSHFRL